MNETLEPLELNRVSLSDDNADLWYRAFSFLRTNEALKSGASQCGQHPGIPQETCVVVPLRWIQPANPNAMGNVSTISSGMGS
jgi:hypothetical protein